MNGALRTDRWYVDAIKNVYNPNRFYNEGDHCGYYAYSKNYEMLVFPDFVVDLVRKPEDRFGQFDLHNIR